MISVRVRRLVGRITLVSVGGTTVMDSTRYSKLPCSVVSAIVSPTRICFKDRKNVSRWPASTTLPSSPGSAVSARCPTASQHGGRFSLGNHRPETDTPAFDLTNRAPLIAIIGVRADPTVTTGLGSANRRCSLAWYASASRTTQAT